MLKAHHEQVFHESAAHHAAPVVHHYVSVEHKGLHTPLHHFSTPVPSVPVHPTSVLPVHKHVSPWDKIKAAASRVRHLGRKSTGAVGSTTKTVAQKTKSLKESERAARLAGGYHALDEAQKAITNRHLA